MKYKKLTREQILISVDRLTRFKNTKDKYLRVFSDIVTSCLIEPKIKKNEIPNMSYKELVNIVETIFNASLDKEISNNWIINKLLMNYENCLFNNDVATQALLDNKIDYYSAISNISGDMPLNIKWLSTLCQTNNSVIARKTNSLKYPLEKILLVEGLTEEILLPKFFNYKGYDFDKFGIQIIPAGGKNQVVKLFYSLVNECKLPIFVLLDKDAEENIRQITPKLRDIDQIHLVSCGEFEDLLPKSLIIKSVNSMFKNFLTISQTDLDDSVSRAKNLEEIFRIKGLHEFKKAEFAKVVRDNITEDSDISNEILEIINMVFKV